MTKPMAVYFTALAVCCAPAAALQSDNPIPPSGGAIKFAEQETVTELPHALDAGWEGERTCELLFENDEMRSVRCAFPPGVGHEKHYHPPHWGYIIEGGVMQITDADGTREQETPAGATWWSDGVSWHEALNIGETTTVFVIVEPKGARE